jgi:hypothetical protein
MQQQFQLLPPGPVQLSIADNLLLLFTIGGGRHQATVVDVKHDRPIAEKLPVIMSTLTSGDQVK